MKVLTTACRAARRSQPQQQGVLDDTDESPLTLEADDMRAERSGGEVLTLMTP
jgi:hypothetical protein